MLLAANGLAAVGLPAGGPAASILIPGRSRTELKKCLVGRGFHDSRVSLMINLEYFGWILFYCAKTPFVEIA